LAGQLGEFKGKVSFFATCRKQRVSIQFKLIKNLFKIKYELNRIVTANSQCSMSRKKKT